MKINASCIACQTETSAALCDECVMKHLGYEAVWAIRYRNKFRVFAYEEEAHQAEKDSLIWKTVRIFAPINYA